MDERNQPVIATDAAKRKIGFFIHLFVYVVVNGALIGLNLSTEPSRLWSMWPLFGWGIGIVFHALLVFVYPAGRVIKGRMMHRRMNRLQGN